MKLPAPAPRRGSILLVSLVDVLFVLLLFFLLASKAATVPALPLDFSRVAVAASPVMKLESADRCRLDGRQQLLETCIVLLRRDAPTQIEVQALQGLSLDDLLPALEQLRAAGLTPLLGQPQ